MECQRSSIRRLGRAGVNVEFRNSYDHREGDQKKGRNTSSIPSFGCGLLLGATHMPRKGD